MDSESIDQRSIELYWKSLLHWISVSFIIRPILIELFARVQLELYSHNLAAAMWQPFRKEFVAFIFIGDTEKNVSGDSEL